MINIIIDQMTTPTDEKLLETILGTLQDRAVYVGIPEEKAPRKEDAMNNATLLYIHSNGSAVKNIPARPVIEPAIEDSDNQQRINELLLKAVLEKLKNNNIGFMQGLEKVGMLAQNICRDWFTNPKNGWPPNTLATVKRKLRKMKGKKKKQAIADFEAGLPVDKPLIDTGALRKSIVYVVK